MDVCAPTGRRDGEAGDVQGGRGGWGQGGGGAGRGGGVPDEEVPGPQGGVPSLPKEGHARDTGERARYVYPYVLLPALCKQATLKERAFESPTDCPDATVGSIHGRTYDVPSVISPESGVVSWRRWFVRVCGCCFAPKASTTACCSWWYVCAHRTVCFPRVFSPDAMLASRPRVVFCFKHGTLSFSSV